MMHRTIVLALLLAVSLVGKGQTKYEQFIKAAKKVIRRRNIR